MYYINKITREILQKIAFQSESSDGTWGRAEFAGARKIGKQNTYECVREQSMPNRK